MGEIVRKITFNVIVHRIVNKGENEALIVKFTFGLTIIITNYP